MYQYKTKRIENNLGKKSDRFPNDGPFDKRKKKKIEWLQCTEGTRTPSYDRLSGEMQFNESRNINKE